jgi:hypothetical protein
MQMFVKVHQVLRIMKLADGQPNRISHYAFTLFTCVNNT